MVPKDTPTGTFVKFQRGSTVLKYIGDGCCDALFFAEVVVEGLCAHVGDTDDCWCRSDFDVLETKEWKK